MPPFRSLAIYLALAAAQAAGAPLLLEDVLESTEMHHPVLLAQIAERAAAQGKVLGAQGAFDAKLKANSGTNRFGYYKTRTTGAGISQPLRGLGGEIFGGYKRGLGNFEPWKEGLLTLSRGEWSGGIEVPLLRDRQIDERRTDALLARLAVEYADAGILEQRLELLQAAASTYWSWVAAGQNLAIATDLLALAEDRAVQVESLVDAGQVAAIEIVENERAVLLRRSATAAAERSLQAASLDLSLFLRDANGNIVQVGRDRLSEFPEPESLPPGALEADLGMALQRRPDIASLLVEIQRVGAAQQLARNLLRPELSLTAEFGRDAGRGTISKQGSELIVGLTLESPFQRRKARGEIAVQNAKQEQLVHKLHYVRDKAEVAVRDAASALDLALQRLDLARNEYALARRLAAAELERFELGDSTLFIVNQREMAAAGARSAVVRALADCHRATAAYRAATAAL
ncbi:MAG: TolC family protein [Bryobacterales bacterium]|nr:TolC family protein [Bryobacterales bacterium]